MMLRKSLPLLAAAVLLAASGCCNPYMFRGCGDGCYGPPAPCGPEVTACQTAEPCGGCGACDACGPAPGCGGCGWYPGMQLWRWLTCGAGCGGVYVNEWVSDPPDCCDPCDGGGNYTGQPCCTPLCFGFLTHLLGEPCHETCGPSMGCASGCDVYGGGDYGGVPVMSDGVYAPMAPSPKVVPGSPADMQMQMEDLPVPPPAPTKASNTTTAQRVRSQKGVYYPSGRVRHR